MGDKPEECQGLKQYAETAKEVKEIRGLIVTLSETSIINKNNLEHMTVTLKELAISNNLTHYKLFARAEKLNIGLGKVETAIESHVDNDKTHGVNKRHGMTLVLSLVAIGISIITVVIIAKQAGIF